MLELFRLAKLHLGGIKYWMKYGMYSYLGEQSSSSFSFQLL